MEANALCELCSQGLGLCLFLSQEFFSLCALSFHHFLIGRSGLHGVTAWDKAVSCESVAYLYDISCFACSLYILFQYYFHFISPV